MKAEFKKLKKREAELSICIRCGYCYELCHLFKSSHWEGDTPRGQLVLAYGLLTGGIEASSYVAEKIFQCFNCKNCEKSCSANVPVTDIIRDARADLIEAGFEVEGTTAIIDDGLCSRCGVCISVCKPEAIWVQTDGKLTVDRVKCEGCGVCTASCPSGAIYQREGWGVTQGELWGRVLNSLQEA
jgi:ferredoxin